MGCAARGPRGDESQVSAPFRLRTALLALLVVNSACGGESAGGSDAANASDRSRPGASSPDTIPAAGGGGAACVPAGAPITGDGVGEVRVGRAVAGLRAACVARDTIFTLGEGLMEQGLSVDAPGAPVVAMYTGGDRVTRVIVSAPGPRTAAGIGVGSTIGEVRRAYPRACVLVGEGRLVVAVDEVRGLSLGTTASLARLVAGGRAPSLQALPDTARVSGLWMLGDAGVACPRSPAG